MQKVADSLFDNIIKQVGDFFRFFDLSKIYKQCCPYCATELEDYQIRCHNCKGFVDSY